MGRPPPEGAKVAYARLNCSLDQKTSDVINRDCETQNQDIGGYKRHVKDAAAGEQPRPLQSVGNSKIPNRNDRKEHCERERIE